MKVENLIVAGLLALQSRLHHQMAASACLDCEVLINIARRGNRTCPYYTPAIGIKTPVSVLETVSDYMFTILSEQLHHVLPQNRSAEFVISKIGSTIQWFRSVHLVSSPAPREPYGSFLGT